MLHTYLTDRLGLRYPIVGAPMAGTGGGRLAGAITRAGGLGMIGIGSETPLEYIEREAAVARGEDGTGFGFGLMVWSLADRPELLDAALAEHPALVSLSFGSPGPYVEGAHSAGALVATQVHSAAEAREAEGAGVDIIVAQGTEAGGHSNWPEIGTLPLLQLVLSTVRIPVLAAGGIASAAGLAAVLAAGADGAWIGTAFLACTECANTEEARRRVLGADETETILTDVFDRVQDLGWPAQHPGRALRNTFTAQWHGRSYALDAEARARYAEARTTRDYDTAVIYAGQAVGMVTEERPAAQVVEEIGAGAEAVLRGRIHSLLAGDTAVSDRRRSTT